MFIPFKDDNPTRRFAIVTFLLIIANILVFLYQILGAAGFEATTYALGLVPKELFAGGGIAEPAHFVPRTALLTSMFSHGSIPHLAFNMLFLWIFGNNVEDRMSRPGYLVFYILIGIVSALAFVFLSPASEAPLVGASGAVSGVLGAYLFMYPMARVHVWMLFFTMRMPALLFLLIWFALQVFGLLGSVAGGSNVAWISHVSGFIAGILLFRLFTRARA